ncbi:MAG: hypothetical protein ACRDQW_10795 [Haloechinothrix sp.]
MASLFRKLAHFASSPQGRRMIDQAKTFARDPKRQAQAKDALGKLRHRTQGNRPGPGPSDPGPREAGPRDPGPRGPGGQGPSQPPRPQGPTQP